MCVTATARVARATPDGYTIGIGNWSSYVASGAVYPMQYDLLKDFEPVMLLPSVPYWLVARKNLPPKDIRELVDWLKTNGDKATAATTGAGSASRARAAGCPGRRNAGPRQSPRSR